MDQKVSINNDIETNNDETLYDYFKQKLKPFEPKKDSDVFYNMPNSESNDYIDVMGLAVKWIDKFLKWENKEIYLGYFIYFLSMACSLFRITKIAVSIYSQRNSIIEPSLLSILVQFCFPLIAFAWLTYYEYWNFHNRKIMFFSAIPSSIVVSAASVLSFLYGISLRPLVFLLPVTPDITPTLILNISRVINLAFVMVPSIWISYHFICFLKADDTLEELFRFKIRKHLDLRKNKEFLYDLRFFKNLDTGKVYKVKMKDRNLHTAVGGSSGTSKTSACLTVAICDDLDQKVHNDDYCKKELEKLLADEKIGLSQNLNDSEFNINVFEGLTDEGKNLLEKLKKKAPTAGITCLAPTAAFADEIYELATNRGFKVNRIDPILLPNGEHKPGFIGFNPLYISPEVEGFQRDIEIIKKAKLMADVLQAILELAGHSDSYFSKLNKNFATAFTVLLELTMPTMKPGHQVTPTDVQDLINNFDNVLPYYKEFIRLYAKEPQRYTKVDGDIDLLRTKFADCGNYQYIAALIENDILKPKNRESIEGQLRGLRTIISDFINNPLIRNVFCAQESIDLDKALANGEITVVNYALELGQAESTAFGLFFALSFNNAVTRRPGTEFTRIPHYYYVDELPLLLHPDHEQMFTMFRQFNVSNFVAFQTYDLFHKNTTTRYLKDVVLNNAAHKIAFGRTSINEMKMYSELAGKKMVLIDQETVSQTTLSDPDTSLSESNRTTPTWINKREGVSFYNMDFQEINVFTVNQGDPVDVFSAKVSFLSKRRRNRKVKRYQVDWSKYDIITTEEESNIVEMPVMESAYVRTGTYDNVDIPNNHILNTEKNSVNGFTNSQLNVTSVHFQDSSIATTTSIDNSSLVDNTVSVTSFNQPLGHASADALSSFFERRPQTENMVSSLPTEENTTLTNDDYELAELVNAKSYYENVATEEYLAQIVDESETNPLYRDPVYESDLDSGALDISGLDAFWNSMDD